MTTFRFLNHLGIGYLHVAIKEIVSRISFGVRGASGMEALC